MIYGKQGIIPILLIHTGSHSGGKDKFYLMPEPLIREPKAGNYRFERTDQLIGKRK